jgi:hypothetical protein
MGRRAAMDAPISSHTGLVDGILAAAGIASDIIRNHVG